jgi:hypothetical protein
MEGGEAIPEPRRDLIVKAFNPSFDHQKEASTVHASSGDAAEQKSEAIGAARNAKEAAVAKDIAERTAKGNAFAAEAAAKKAAGEVAAEADKKKALQEFK